VKTSNKDFVYFKKCCEKWMKYFGLLDWEPFFEYEQDDDNVFARATWDIESMSVTFRLSTEWPDKVTKKTIDGTAFHEVCHVLLGKLDCQIRSRGYDETMTDSEIHSVIRVLENVLLTN